MADAKLDANRKSALIVVSNGDNDTPVRLWADPITHRLLVDTSLTSSGTFVVQENGAALTALQLIDDSIYADDADWTDSTSKHILIGGLYQSSQQTITDGDVGPLEVDANGNLKVVLQSGTNLAGRINIVDGNNTHRLNIMADDSAFDANPAFAPVGGEYRSVATVYSDGDATILQTDINGFLRTTLATLISGEDLTNDVLKVEQRYSYSYLVADGLVKTGAGFVHTVTFSPLDAAATAGTIFLYDKTTEATPTIFSYYIPAAALVPVTVTLDVSFTTGLYIGFTTTADVAVTTSYR